MSSCVVVNCTQGFVISTDSIVFKTPQADPVNQFGQIRGTTRKLFQISDDVIAAGVGDWSSYMPIFNSAARLKLPAAKVVDVILDQSMKKAADSRVFILSRIEGKVILDISELGHVRRDQTGAVAYPNPVINGLFLKAYESPEGLAIRSAGLLGVTALVAALNAMAVSLSSDLSAPFDTVAFLKDGLFAVTGGATRLPVTDFW
jgi:hypothetical protein